MPKRNYRVEIPKNPDQLIALLQRIVNKHETDGVSSPLSGLNMADFKAKITAAADKHTRAAEHRRQAELLTKERDAALGIALLADGTGRQYAASARDILIGLHKGNERKLGEWGFNVDDSPRVRFNGGNGNGQQPGA